MFPPLNLAAEVRFRGTFLRGGRGLPTLTFRRMVFMANTDILLKQEMIPLSNGAAAPLKERAKPYVAAILIMTALMSIWVGLCAA